MTEHPEVRDEYERLGPRYAVIEEVIKARQRAKLSQRELAERMGVKQPVVGRLEGGRHDPRLDTIVRAAGALGCDVEIKFKRAGVNGLTQQLRQSPGPVDFSEGAVTCGPTSARPGRGAAPLTRTGPTSEAPARAGR